MDGIIAAIFYILYLLLFDALGTNFLVNIIVSIVMGTCSSCCFLRILCYLDGTKEQRGKKKKSRNE